jgi:hypothetical protein
LTPEEANQQGPLLRQCAIVVDRLLEPEQTYVCLWSHAGGEPGYLHYVIQLITERLWTTTASRTGAAGRDVR